MENVELIYAGVVVIALLIGGLFGGATGMVYAMQKISKNPQVIRANESQFDKASEERQELLKIVANAFGMAERLAMNVAPVSKVTQAIDYAEDTLREITDGVPFDSKTPVVPPTVTVDAGAFDVHITPPQEGVK